MSEQAPCWHHPTCISLTIQWRKMFLKRGQKYCMLSAHKIFTTIHPNAFKPHPFCANLTVKWMLIYKISQKSQVRLISAYNKTIGLVRWDYAHYNEKMGEGGRQHHPSPLRQCHSYADFMFHLHSDLTRAIVVADVLHM